MSASNTRRHAEDPRAEPVDAVEERGAFDPSAYVEILFRHRRLIASCVGAAVAAAWLALAVWPRVYESEAKLLVRVGRESVALDPTATTSETFLLQKTHEEEVLSALEVLGSRQVAQHVVAKIGVGPILDGALPDEGGEPAADRGPNPVRWVAGAASAALDFCLRTARLRDPIGNEELAIQRVLGQTHVSASKKSNVITIRVEGKSPRMAQAIASKMTEAYLDQHLKSSHTQGSRQFFETQSREVERQLSELIAQKSEYLQKHQLVSVDAKRELLKSQILAVESELITNRAALEQVLAEIVDLERHSQGSADTVVETTQQQTDSTWSAMRQKVYELELQEKQLDAKFLANYPALVAVREQLTGAREILKEFDSERTNDTTAVNPSKRRMLESLQQLQTRLAGLRSSQVEKASHRESLVEATSELLQQEVALKKLDRDIEILETSLATLSDKLEEARVIDELQTERISNIDIFQPASLIERPVSPKKKLLALAALVGGLFGGCGLAFVREANDSRMRTPRHVESRLQRPVLTQFPFIPDLQSMSSGHHRRMLTSCSRAILTDLLLDRSAAGRRRRGKTLGVIACDSGSGASTVAAGLTLAAAGECNLRAILIDSDARTRSVSTAFGSNGAPGLAELISGDADPAECIQHLNRFGVDLVSASAPDARGRAPADPDEIARALRRLQADADLLIVDLPPASQPDQAVAVAQHLDYVVLVVESERTEQAEAERLLKRLESSDVKVIGIALNKMRNHLPRWIGRSFRPSPHVT